MLSSDAQKEKNLKNGTATTISSNTLPQKIIRGIKNPQLFIKYILRNYKYLFLKKYKWQGADSNIKKKKFRTYQEYLEHQKSKLETIKKDFFAAYDIKYRHELNRRLQEQNIVRSGMTVLCLAARIGTEVKAFLDLGCFAIGLDLNPGQGNKYVVCGDFHDIQFPNHSVDVVFSNSLDHTFDFEKLIKEIKRILKPEGFLVLEIVKGTEEGYTPGYYETSSWKKIDDLVAIFLKSDFKVIKKVDFEYPWNGQHISLTLKSINKITVQP